MKFLLDMGIARSTAEYLRRQGHNALHLRDEHLQRLPDEQIITKARAEERIIITHDLDFSRLIALSQQPMPSAITMRMNNMQPENVNQHLLEVISHFETELSAGALVSVNERGIRVRLLPVD